jgi:hypothetical protein
MKISLPSGFSIASLTFGFIKIKDITFLAIVAFFLELSPKLVCEDGNNWNFNLSETSVNKLRR